MTMFQNLGRMMREAQTLKIRCEACNHGAVWTQAEAFRWLGSDATPPEVRARLVCHRCGGRAHVWI